LQATLPHYAPDLHKVIEHAHGRAEKKFRRWLYLHPRNCSTEEYTANFKQIFLRKSLTYGLPTMVYGCTVLRNCCVRAPGCS
jgi:hypothetical protein